MCRDLEDFRAEVDRQGLQSSLWLAATEERGVGREQREHPLYQSWGPCLRHSGCPQTMALSSLERGSHPKDFGPHTLSLLPVPLGQGLPKPWTLGWPRSFHL